MSGCPLSSSELLKLPPAPDLNDFYDEPILKCSKKDLDEMIRPFKEAELIAEEKCKRLEIANQILEEKIKYIYSIINK